MTIYIIRHGETEMNRLGIVQGSGVDSDLNDVGRQQAQLFHEYYKDVHFDAILTSKLKRTHQTVAPFLEKGIVWEQFAELNEISWGTHEGKAPDPNNRQAFDNLMKAWNSGNYDARIEGGESARELADRLQIVVAHFGNLKVVKRNVLVCTHGRTLSCLVALLHNVSLHEMRNHKHQNTCLYKFHYLDGEFVMELENDVRHLRR
jgi:phosphoserine phosphatase